MDYYLNKLDFQFQYILLMISKLLIFIPVIQIRLWALKIFSKVFLNCLPKSGHCEFRIDMCHKLENKSIFVNLEDICKKQFDFRDPLCHLKKNNVTEFKVKIDFEFLDNIDVNDLKNLEKDVKGILSLGISAEPIVKDKMGEWKRFFVFLG